MKLARTWPDTVAYLEISKLVRRPRRGPSEQNRSSCTMASFLPPSPASVSVSSSLASSSSSSSCSASPSSISSINTEDLLSPEKNQHARHDCGVSKNLEIIWTIPVDKNSECTIASSPDFERGPERLPCGPATGRRPSISQSRREYSARARSTPTSSSSPVQYESTPQQPLHQQQERWRVSPSPSHSDRRPSRPRPRSGKQQERLKLARYLQARTVPVNVTIPPMNEPELAIRTWRMFYEHSELIDKTVHPILEYRHSIYDQRLYAGDVDDVDDDDGDVEWEEEYHRIQRSERVLQRELNRIDDRFARIRLRRREVWQRHQQLLQQQEREEKHEDNEHCQRRTENDSAMRRSDGAQSVLCSPIATNQRQDISSMIDLPTLPSSTTSAKTKKTTHRIHIKDQIPMKVVGVIGAAVLSLTGMKHIFDQHPYQYQILSSGPTRLQKDVFHYRQTNTSDRLLQVELVATKFCRNLTHVFGDDDTMRRKCAVTSETNLIWGASWSLSSPQEY